MPNQGSGLIVIWVTLTPASSGFLGAPYVESLRGVRPLGAALSADTAAVVGVILNLAGQTSPEEECSIGGAVHFGLAGEPGPIPLVAPYNRPDRLRRVSRGRTPARGQLPPRGEGRILSTGKDNQCRS
jgi:hypothetical protein